MKNDEMGKKLPLQNLKERDHLSVTDIDGKLKLK
jgi:hypothetical protein